MEDIESKREQLLSQLSKLPEPQVKELREKIQSMAPAEFEKFASGQEECIFCAISSGKMECFKIYEDDDIIAILDINPISKGHALVLPKKHFQFLLQMPDELVCKLFKTVSTLMPLLINATQSQGVNILINQGAVAGQNVEHLFVNIIPRYAEDNLVFNWQRQKVQKEDLGNLAAQLSEKVASVKRQDEEKKREEEKRKEEAEKGKIEEKIKADSDLEKIFKQVKRRMP